MNLQIADGQHYLCKWKIDDRLKVKHKSRHNVIRKTSKEDKRVLHIMLSEKAQTELKRMTHERVAAFAVFFEVLDDEEFSEYVVLNKKIISRIQSL